MELEVQESVKLEDGKHQGTVVAVDHRTEPYNYVDVVIKPKDTSLMLKSGYPAFLNEESKLGQLIKRFGMEIIVGSKIDPEKVLLGKKVEFMTITQPSKKDGKNYSNIIPDSVKPLQEGLQVENAR